MRFNGHFWKGLVLVTILMPLSICSPAGEHVGKRKPTCKDVVIPVSVRATGINMAPTTTFTQALNLVTNLVDFLVNLLFDNIIEGTFDIGGTYCEPATFNASRTNTVQFLIHGATVNGRYYSFPRCKPTANIYKWSGDGPVGAGYGGVEYSWVDYASNEGYPTFFIDRLGFGVSSHPDPILDVQIPTEVQIAHSIINLLKTGASPFPRKFTKIIVAGHSAGSVITHQLSVTYPNDASAYMLTGYSNTYANVLAGLFLTGLLLPAAIVQPAKYGNLPLGYLEPSSESGVLYLFWYDPHANGTYYDPAFPAFDYALRQSLTVGEAATAAVIATTLPTSATTGHVLVITGQQDVLFCGTTALLGAGPGQCVGGPLNYLANTKELFPRADYSYCSIANAGHLWQFHYAAQEGFEYTHNWLTSRGY